MKQFLLFAATAVLFAACGKSKFETVPQVKITSFGPETVTKGQIFTLKAEVTDKEGDLQDSLLLVRKRFTGTTQVPARNDDTTKLRIADFAFPNASTIELQIRFAYGEQITDTQLYNIQEGVDRGVTYTIIVSDKAKNKSTPAETKMITLKKV